MRGFGDGECNLVPWVMNSASFSAAVVCREDPLAIHGIYSVGLPASIKRVSPVIRIDKSLAQNSATRATSSGTPTRPSGSISEKV